MRRVSQTCPDAAVDRDDNRIAVIFGVLFACGGLVFAVGGVGAYHRDTTLLAAGERVTAQVVALDRIRDASPDGSTDYLVKYRFTTHDGRTIVKQGGLGQAAWRALRVGGPVEVAYDPANPTKGLLVGGGVTSLPLVVISTLFGLVMGGFGLALLGTVARRWWNRTRAAG